MASFLPIRTAARLARNTNSSLLRSTPRASISPQSIAAFHQSVISRSPYKDDQDRESLKPKVHEYSNEDSEAAHSDAAFDPSKTRPEESGAAAKNNSSSNGGAALGGSPTDKETAEAGRGKAEDKPGQGNDKASRSHDATKSGKL